jgi:Fe-S-cluster containining protein
LVKIGRAARSASAGAATILTLSPRGRGAERPSAAARPHPCATCGACCRSYLVPVCGYDVWLISRRLHLDPARFVVAWQEEEPSVDGFRTEPDGPLYSLVLDKRRWSRGGSACVFLLRLPGGHDRCGIYEHRPVSCRAYPMVLLRGAVALGDDPLCPPGAWPTGSAGAACSLLATLCCWRSTSSCCCRWSTRLPWSAAWCCSARTTPPPTAC